MKPSYTKDSSWDMQCKNISYEQIQYDLQLSAPLPVTENWSAAADFLNTIKQFVLDTHPETIVECSSGTSTIVLARCCEINHTGKVFSFENGREYATNTQQQLAAFNLSQYAEVLFTPLNKVQLDQNSYDWYEYTQVSPPAIDMLVIDGPPGFIQKHSRYPALPILFKYLSSKATVFLDDAARDDEKEIIDMWLQLPAKIEHEYIDNERGCSILTIEKL